MTPLTGELSVPRDDGDSVPIVLGPVLAKAGEGTIRMIEGRPGSVAKIFHPNLEGLPQKLEKVAAMVTSRPTGATQADGFTVLTWPTEMIRQNDAAVGYVMPRIDTTNAVEIHALSNPFNRSNPLAHSPQWPARANWKHLVTAAANLCVAVDVVHQADAVVGDFQERNVLVSDTCRVTLVDCDSMQFTDPAGQVHLCAVGRPDFSAPELLGQDLSTHARSRESDLFALAVHIYLLLLAGNHPFLRGTWLGTAEQPGPMTLAKSGDWAGGRNSRLQTHPLAPPVDFLPEELRALFACAFTSGATDPATRPTASQWHAALLGVDVGDCFQGVHQVPTGTRTCPWCAIELERSRRRKARISPVPQTLAAVPAPAARTTKPAAITGQVAASAADGRPVGTRPAKVRPPFRATGSTRRAAKPMSTSDDVGRSLYQLFLFIAVPSGIGVLILVIFVIIEVVQHI